MDFLECSRSFSVHILSASINDLPADEKLYEADPNVVEIFSFINIDRRDQSKNTLSRLSSSVENYLNMSLCRVCERYVKRNLQKSVEIAQISL